MIWVALQARRSAQTEYQDKRGPTNFKTVPRQERRNKLQDHVVKSKKKKAIHFEYHVGRKKVYAWLKTRS
jgi:hypothetical protein